jgi:predicted glycosyltransferase
MKLLFDIGHPAHVHFFKNVIKNLENRGHELKITARNKEVAMTLLRNYGIKYHNVGDNHDGMLQKAMGMLAIDYEVYKIVKDFNPSLLIGVASPYVAQVSKLNGAKSIIFTDTEYVKTSNLLSFPFADTICTPACFREAISMKKHVKFNGYKEIAYLHPKYFRPDASVLELLGLSKNEKFIIMRLISWKANHDTDLKGIRNIEAFVRKLESYGRVLICSEGHLDKKLEKYALNIPPEKLHSLIAFASLYIGEGGTTTVEAALSGTPAIHIELNSKGKATGESSGNFLELRDKYNLLYFYPDEEKAFEKAKEILDNNNSKADWGKRKERLLKDKIDVTAWMTDFIERYPESFQEYKIGNV